MSELPFKFPTRDEGPAWEQAVNSAIERGSLKWVPVLDTQWELHGTCPRCEHQTAEYYDFGVVVAETFTVAEYREAPTDTAKLPIEWACLCQENEPHRKDTQGCGAGRDLLISVSPPWKAS